MIKKYILQDREAGNYIDSFATYEQALNTLIRYEEEDKQERIYTDDFYEIVENEEHEIINKLIDENLEKYGFVTDSDNANFDDIADIEIITNIYKKESENDEIDSDDIRDELNKRVKEEKLFKTRFIYNSDYQVIYTTAKMELNEILDKYYNISEFDKIEKLMEGKNE